MQKVKENLLNKSELLNIGELIAEILLVDKIENWSILIKHYEEHYSKIFSTQRRTNNSNST